MGKMTYFDAISIKQDLIVNIQYADAFSKTAEEAIKETAEKYSIEQYVEAYTAIKKHMDEELKTVKTLFKLAVQSKGILLPKKTASKKNRRWK